MLLTYRSDYQKVAMGMFSLVPEFNNLNRVTQELAWYTSGHGRHLYLWKDAADNFAGALGVSDLDVYLIVRRIILMPDALNQQNELTMLDQLHTLVPDRQLMGTLDTTSVIAEWEQQYEKHHR